MRVEPSRLKRLVEILSLISNSNKMKNDEIIPQFQTPKG
jgi:hypothetical protein